jgi:tungstate transport system substrate-binding protein
VSRFLLFSVLVALALWAAGCSSPQPETITLATTTSTRDTGLLDALLPLFRERTGIEVKPVAVGSGQALELARRGDADVLLVHDPVGEEKFMAEGHGALRRAVMHNDFVLVGPKDDAAAIKGIGSINAAFVRIAQRKATFVSRGDESGTHAKEKAVWRESGIEPADDWYVRAGDGMAAVLRMADEKRAYTLTDRGTFLAQRKKGLDLIVLCEGDPLLVNSYSVIVVSPDKHPHVREQAARKFADFLLSPEGQKVIVDFGKKEFGEPLFFLEAAGK